VAVRPNAHTLPVDWATIITALSRSADNPCISRFYAACITDPRTVLGQLPLVALDFETTGLDPENDSIVSIGLVPFDLHRIYCRQARYWLVKPDGVLAESSVLVHGITHGKIESAQGLSSIIELMLDSLSGRMVVVHCHSIERQFLENGTSRCFGEAIQFPLIDTMLIEEAVHKQRKGSLLGLFKKTAPPSVRLGDSRVRYGLPRYRQHHALTDAIASAELFQAQVSHHLTDQTPVSDLWV